MRNNLIELLFDLRYDAGFCGLVLDFTPQSLLKFSNFENFWCFSKMCGGMANIPNL